MKKYGDDFNHLKYRHFVEVVFDETQTALSEKEMAMKIYCILTDRFKEKHCSMSNYIDAPKENGYQSIHVKLLGYQMGGKAIPMNEELLNSADLIIVMTEHHSNEVTRLLKYDHWNRIVRFNDYCFEDHTDLPDPHYQTEYVYRTCFDTIERGCVEIIKNYTNDKRTVTR